MSKTKTQVANESHVDTVRAMETMSARIRYLDRAGYTKYQISKFLSRIYGADQGFPNGVRYQWVRGVLNQPLKS